MMEDEGLPEERGPGLGDAPEPDEADLETAQSTKLFGPGDFHNVEAEAALLGALMIDNRIASEVSQRLRDEDFFEPLHGRIYHAIVRMVGNSKTASPVTLRPIFTHDPDMQQLGGPSYLAQLTGSGAAIIGARDFAEQVIELSRMRRLYGAMIVAVRSFQETGEIAEAVDRLEREIWTAADAYRPIRILNAGAMIGLVEARAERIALQATSSIGAMSRTVPEINNVLGGLEGGQYTLLAGRPSMGKTTLAVSFAWGCAANGHPTFYAHAESSSELMALKVATDISYDLGERIEFKRVKSGQLHKREADALAAAKEQAQLLPIRFADVGRADITRLEAAVAREVAYWAAQQRKLELVVIDYIGLIGATDGEGRRALDDRVRVGRVSKAILDMAKKYDVHVLALAQLSRKVEERSATDRRPMLSDLRDSGDLEQDADNVLFIHRPEFYLVDEKPKPTTDPKKAGLYEAQLKDWELDMAEWGDKAEIIVGKNRLGERASRRVKFLSDYSAVRSLTHRHRDADDEEDEGLFMEGTDEYGGAELGARGPRAGPGI